MKTRMSFSSVTLFFTPIIGLLITVLLVFAVGITAWFIRLSPADYDFQFFVAFAGISYSLVALNILSYCLKKQLTDDVNFKTYFEKSEAEAIRTARADVLWYPFRLLRTARRFLRESEATDAEIFWQLGMIRIFYLFWLFGFLAAGFVFGAAEPYLSLPYRTVAATIIPLPL